MNDDRTRVGNSAVQCLTIRAVEFGHVQMFCLTIQPVEFSPYPIDGYSLKAETVVTDYRFLLAACGRNSARNVINKG